MTEQEEKRYDPQRDKFLKFVLRPDDITLDDDPNMLRAEMSCGHAVTPESLTGWCRSLLDKGQYKFLCPALKNQTKNEACGAEWSYTEVRRMALLTEEEQRHFEKTMAELAAAVYKPCPSCKTFVERQNLNKLRVSCTICEAETGTKYEFCWKCLKTWKGAALRSDTCDNIGCVDPQILILTTCRDITLTAVKNITVPSIRACPTCGNLVEHDTTKCKNIICNRCQKEFCFSCLKLTPECLKNSSHFRACSTGVAPRQTSIPTWNK